MSSSVPGAGSEEGGQGAFPGGLQKVVIAFDGEGPFWQDVARFGIVLVGFFRHRAECPLSLLPV